MKNKIRMILLMTLVMLAAVPMTSMAVKEGSGLKKATPSNYEDDEEEYDPDEDMEVYVEPEIDRSADENVVISEAGGSENKEAEAQEKETEAVKETEKAKDVKTEAVTAEELAGSWTIDGVTDLKFNKDGSGALSVPARQFAFSWKLEDDRLSLSFEDSAVRDVVYDVSKKGLTIVISEDGTSYTLKR